MLEGMEAWEVVDRTEYMNFIESTRDFNLKQFPDGRIKNFKGNFCACIYKKL